MEDLEVKPIDVECSRKSTKRKRTTSTSSRKKRSKETELSTRPLDNKRFFFDGDFEDITVTKEKIEHLGGKVLQRCTKLTGELTCCGYVLAVFLPNSQHFYRSNLFRLHRARGKLEVW